MQEAGPNRALLFLPVWKDPKPSPSPGEWRWPSGWNSPGSGVGRARVGDRNYWTS